MRISTAGLAVVLALLMSSAAMAQQRTIYSDGKVIGRESTGTDGSTTLYGGADGRVRARTSTSGNQTTIFNADGRRVGTTVTTTKPASRNDYRRLRRSF
jgi:hypothetical protein